MKPAEGSNEVHEIVYPTKGLEDVIAMGLQGFLENYSTANVPSLRGKAYQKMDRSIAVNLHSSGLLLPSGCELSPSHHHKLPVLMTTSESTNDSTRIDEEDEVPHPEVHFVDEKAVEETRIPPKDSKSNYEPEPVIAPKSQDTVSYESQEEKKIQPKGQNSKKPKGTSWNIEFDTPEEKPSVRVGNDLLRNRNFLSEKQDEKYDPVMSPYYSNAKSNSFEHLDHDLPQPPTQVDGKNKQPPPQTQLYDDHSVGSISTMDQTVKRGAVIEPKKKPEEKRNIPRWGQLPHGQATIIRPICVHRDSTPLRCVAMLTPPHADILEDSLGISHSNNEKPYSLLAVGSNSKSISILHYDHSARDSSGKVTIIDELSGVHNGSVYAVDWSNDGRSLASGSNDKYVRIIS